jgi:hypothetical protein
VFHPLTDDWNACWLPPVSAQAVALVPPAPAPGPLEPHPATSIRTAAPTAAARERLEVLVAISAVLPRPAMELQRYRHSAL